PCSITTMTISAPAASRGSALCSCQRERSCIDQFARQTGRGSNQCRGVLHAVGGERQAQASIKVLGIILFRWTDDHGDLASRSMLAVVRRQFGKPASPHFLEALGQF